MVSKNLPPSGASMFLLGGKALAAAKLFNEHNLTLEGLFATIGYKQAFIKYDRQARRSGQSKWSLSKKLKLFADFFVGYSYTVIRAMSYIGIVVALLGLVYALFIILNKIIFSTPIEGWSSIMVALLFIGGIQMVMIGIIGEYLWRTLDESRARPRYIIEEKVNFDQ